MLTKPYKSTAPVPLMKLPPSPGSLYVLRNNNSAGSRDRDSGSTSVQRDNDASISVLRFELGEIGPVLRRLIELVVCPRALNLSP